MESARKSGLAALLVAALLLAGGCYLAWRSGCVFDSKQGIGDAQAGMALSGWALASAAAACCALVFSPFLLLRRPAGFTLVVALGIATVAVPGSIAALLVAESDGTDSCSVNFPNPP